MSEELVDVSERAPFLSQSRSSNTVDPVLSWLIFSALSLLAFVLLWFYGLAQKALTSDPTHITSFIGLIYIASSLHCLWRAMAISREAVAGQNLTRAIVGSVSVLAAANDPRNDGLVAAHIRNLAMKSQLTGEGRRFDQTILLRVLAERLSGPNTFGTFTSDLSMKLGLFGTIVGFIMMLAPIAGLNTEDQAAIKSSLALMSDGMAVAMYSTLAGLVASILIKLQYQFVESAAASLFTSAVALTEVHVIPALERRVGLAQ